MAASILVRDDLVAGLALEIHDLELVTQVAIHDTRVEAIMFAGRTAACLVKPLFEAVIVKDLQAIVTLDIFFLHDVEADGAEEGINEFLIGIHRVFFRHLVVASENKDEILRDFRDLGNEVFSLLLHVFFKPGSDSERALVMNGDNVLLSLNHRNYFQNYKKIIS